jgi:hypothetical protein
MAGSGFAVEFSQKAAPTKQDIDETKHKDSNTPTVSILRDGFGKYDVQSVSPGAVLSSCSPIYPSCYLSSIDD